MGFTNALLIGPVDDPEAASPAVVDRDTTGPRMEEGPDPRRKSRLGAAIESFRSLNVRSGLWYAVTSPGRAIDHFNENYEVCL